MALLYFLVYLFFEILFSYEFAKIFTPIGLFIEVIVTAIVGVYILRTLHFSLAVEMQKVMRMEMTQEEFMTAGLFRLIGAFLLIIPGVFSDILGILFLMEPIARWFAKKFLKPKTTHYQNYHTSSDDDIIDVEIVEIIEKKD
ncbi:FxsA family protein [Caminibacter pacificus]